MMFTMGTFVSGSVDMLSDVTKSELCRGGRGAISPCPISDGRGRANEVDVRVRSEVGR